MSISKLLIITLVLIAFWTLFSGSASVTLGPGIKVDEQPRQHNLKQQTSFTLKDYRITTLANFELKAKVLARENYLLGRESDLSPVDFALGWGQMSDESILSKIAITQSGRWYHWRVDDFPIPRKAIETQSANMHLVPANAAVANLIKQVKKGQVIAMSGYLIRVDANDGWRWQSSLTREDTGANACELVYVEHIELLH